MELKHLMRPQSSPCVLNMSLHAVELSPGQDLQAVHGKVLIDNPCRL